MLMAVEIQARAKLKQPCLIHIKAFQTLTSYPLSKRGPHRGHEREGSVNSLAQRATIVLEHASAISDHDEESYEDSWCVVAYLILDSGKRERVTLHRCKSRSQASAALRTIWDQVIAERAQRASAA